MASEGSIMTSLLIVLHFSKKSTKCGVFQHIAEFYNYNPSIYSYRRRSLALHSVSTKHITSYVLDTAEINVPALVRPQPLYILLRVSRDLCF
jgi:hypothetical protein